MTTTPPQRIRLHFLPARKLSQGIGRFECWRISKAIAGSRDAPGPTLNWTRVDPTRPLGLKHDAAQSAAPSEFMPCDIALAFASKNWPPSPSHSPKPPNPPIFQPPHPPPGSGSSPPRPNMPTVKSMKTYELGPPFLLLLLLLHTTCEIESLHQTEFVRLCQEFSLL